jgi:predicted permease
VVACLNLANMLLARGAARAKEVAVRLALGGKRFQVVRQLLAEGLLLSLAGGVVGLVLAYWTTAIIMSSVVPYVPLGIEFDARPDARMLAVTLAFCVVSAVTFSLGPAWQLTRTNLAVELRTRGEHTAPTRRRRVSVPQLLVVGQLAISLGLLTAAGLFARTAANASASDPGFSTDRQVLATVDASMSGHDEARGRALYATLLDRLRRLPGAEATTVASIVPFGDTSDERLVETPGITSASTAKTQVSAIYTIIGADYFRTLGLRVSGREFSAGEELSAAGAPIAVIDEPLARRLFARESPLDRVICLRQRLDRPCESVQIVGVVPGVRHDVLDPDAVPHVYVPFGRHYTSTMTFHVKTSEPGRAGEAAMVRRLRTEIESIDRELPVLSVKSMRDHHAANIGLWLTRTAAILFATFGALALLLATVGTYGLRAHLVALRTREIGVRMALGATARSIQSLFVREGLRLTAAGLVLGVLFATAAGALSRSFLYQVDPFDPLVIGVASSVLLLTSVLASYVPARRAAATSPSRAMGAE